MKKWKTQDFGLRFMFSVTVFIWLVCWNVLCHFVGSQGWCMTNENHGYEFPAGLTKANCVVFFECFSHLSKSYLLSYLAICPMIFPKSATSYFHTLARIPPKQHPQREDSKMIQDGTSPNRNWWRSIVGTAPCHHLTVPQLLRNRVLRQQKQRVASRGIELGVGVVPQRDRAP